MNSHVSDTYFFLSTYMLSKWDVDLGVTGFQIVTKAGNEDKVTMESVQVSIFFFF